MADSTVGVRQPAAPDKQIDNESLTNDASTTVMRQKITLGDDFAYLSRIGKGYAFSAEVNVVLASETDAILFKNTDATKVVRLFEQISCIPDSTTSVRSIVRVYKNPTVTLNGTAGTAGALRNGQAASVCQVFTLPTISARGTRVQSYGVTSTPTQRELLLCRYVEPLESLLVTFTPSGTNVLHSFGQTWAEV